jgi:hypothetical protein
MMDSHALLGPDGGLAYLGLAPFLRASIAGDDLRPVTQQLLHQLEGNGGNAELVMNLSIAAQCMNQQELGLAFLQEALALQQTYVVPARVQPARLRLLVLVAPGTIQSNTPLECLLEVSDVELVFHYLRADGPLLGAVPAHDVVFVGISDSDANRGLLQSLALELKHWPQPVLNAPQFVPLTGRDRASELLQDIPRLLAPVTSRVSRESLQAVATGQMALAQILPDGDFPIILRPLGSQAGADLQKIDSVQGISSYLAVLQDQHFFLAPFVDYSDAQGQFRKIRIALIAGKAFVCHMAVSSSWMVHYVNAGMYQDAWKRSEEARFMNAFAQFVARHQLALDTIAQRIPLEYLVMDCAETHDGALLLFEIDHGGVVHAMDVEGIFPYKNDHIRKAKEALCTLLYSRLPAPGATPQRGTPAKTGL